MSRPETRRAALGAAFVGVLLALVSCLTGALPSSAALDRVAASSSAPSLDAAPAQVGHAVVRTSHTSFASVTGVDRTSGGHGAPLALAAALLLLAAACLAVAVRRSRGWRAAALDGVRACRAPPASVRA